MLFAYIGPDTMLPVTSIIVAAATAILMFGRLIWHKLASFTRSLLGRSKSTSSASASTSPIRRSAATIRRDTAQETPERPHTESSHSVAESLEETGA